MVEPEPWAPTGSFQNGLERACEVDKHVADQEEPGEKMSGGDTSW